MGVSGGRTIVRTAICADDQRIVGYGFDLTPRSLFVVTEWRPPLGTRVEVEISLLGVIEPIVRAARVLATRPSNGHGEPAGIELAFEDDPDGRVAALVARLASGQSAPQGETFRVLLVEDSGTTRDMFEYGIKKFFADSNVLTLDHAENAEVAWQRLAETRFDLLIIDYFLPAAHGAQLIAQIRAEPRLARTPIVAISVGGAAARDATLSAGADLFLDKPLALRDLFHTLRIALYREREPAPDRKSILVFDDSLIALEIMRAALQQAGFQVEVAGDLAEFEQHRARFSPDLILMDVQMPEAFGDDVALMLREWRGVEVPILLVSSIDESELATRAAEAKAAGYVSKRAGVGELVRRCTELLAGAQS